MRLISPGIAAGIAILLMASRAAQAADPESYRVELAPTGDAALDATLRATSELIALRDSAPVSPFGLIVRARGEADRLKTVLESYGYYQSAVTVTLEGLGLNSPGLADLLSALPAGHPARAAIACKLGPLYHLRKVDVDAALPAAARQAFGLKVGAPAVAAEVLAAGNRLRFALQEQGYAFAKVDAPVAYEDAALPVLDVSFHVVAGAQVDIGEIHLQGLERVHEAMVRRRLTVHSGQRFSTSAVEAARRDLLSLGPFATVSVQVGEAVDASGGVPLTFVLRERKRHAVNLNAAFSSDLGGSGGVTWTDRNVFGNAEQLNVTSSVINLGGSDTTGVGYDTTTKLTLPDFGHRDQSLQFSVGAIKQYLQAYDQKAITSAVTLTRKLSSVWSASAGVSTANEQIDQVGVNHNYTLVGLPMTLSYDSTHLASPLDDPTHGMRDSLSVTPTQSFGRPNATFIISQLKVAAYLDAHDFGLADPGRSVLALRALAGQAQGAGEFSLPPDQRFYGGGSGNIRGYPYQLVGPLFPQCQKLPPPAKGSTATTAVAEPPQTGCSPAADSRIPTGGTAILSGSLEFRQRIAGNWGAALFVDGGQVSEKIILLPSDFQFGAGFGVRYYTPIGPVRFDLAFPLERAATIDQVLQVYIGLGQAF